MVLKNLFAFFRITYRDFDVFHLLTRFLSLRSCVRKKPGEPIESLGKAPPDRPPPTSQHLRCFVVRVLLKYDTRQQFAVELIQFLETTLNVAHKNDRLLEAGNVVRAYSCPKQLPPQQRGQTSHLDRNPSITP